MTYLIALYTVGLLHFVYDALIWKCGDPRWPTVSASRNNACLRGMATALPTGKDTDTDIVRNSKLFGLVSPPPATPPAAGNIDLYFIHQTATLMGKDPVSTVFDLYNGGPNLTSSPAKFVFWTGFYYNLAFGQSGPPPGTTILYSNRRPDVPEIVSVDVPAGFPIGTAYPVIQLDRVVLDAEHGLWCGRE